jgi:hypothetical protein
VYPSPVSPGFHLLLHNATLGYIQHALILTKKDNNNSRQLSTLLTCRSASDELQKSVAFVWKKVNK